MQLDGKIALVTGGGSGIGRETAVLFANHGAKVAVADLNPVGGQETVQMIRYAGGTAVFSQTDVSQAAQVENMVNGVVAEYGRLDIAFNNAGIDGIPVRTADSSEDEYDRIMAVNAKGVWLCLKYEIQQMLLQKSGTIINTASVAGLIGAHSMSAYAASKHAVVGLTKTAAVEYAGKGIRVNAVCPAIIRTAMVERAFAHLPQLEQGAIQNNPSHRIGDPREVAEAVLWLASDASSFTTGATLTVDGGLTAQ
ncbi:MAG: SDR family oxidoreductase [Ardenticatenaceae bacterium]|nr:SDR family oxidoreductase [Anaerolineales bacterium]MCB8937738.1 SDR family oxidoreductase [Ardenticatenaceae bacterium]MCB8974307.1 SDR family oxidoreductase [Ardenticatenaceae bacterium]